MKKAIYCIYITLAGLFVACQDSVKETVVYEINEPIFALATDIRSKAIQTKAAQAIEEQGKLCFYEGYLYISEPGKGIHVIDNRNPSSPKAVSLIELEGNVDIAVLNNKLYADNYVDLVYFDISDPAKPQYLSRLEDAFKYSYPVVDNEIGCDMSAYYAPENQNKIIVGWKLVKREQTIYQYTDGLPMNEGYLSSPNSFADKSPGSSSKGVNGSMSRFSVHKDYLYTVMSSMMSIIDLSGETPVKPVEDIAVDWNVETIFYYKDYMFLGTPTGMSIFSVEDPLRPERMSTTWHINGCDPVVVEDDIAYVTIHSGNTCGQNNNVLIVYDVSDVKSPKMLVSYAMTKPKGLGVDNGTLFVCDDGLRVFDASEPQMIMARELAHYSGMEGYDLIPYNKVLMMIADDGLYQYDYTDVKKISQLSKISIKK